MQQAVSNFVTTAIPQLNNIETMVSNNEPLPQIKTAMVTVQSEMSSLKSTVDGISVQINSASSQVSGYFNQLATIESGLTAQITTLQGKLGDAKSEESAAKKKYYYLLALGPFGLAGLATALGLYLKWKSDVNDYESQISSLNAQITSLNTLQSNCQQMGSDFQGVITKTSRIQNSVDFLASELSTISSDLDAGSSLTVIGLYVNAAITEVQTLGVDAS
jgi:outer membrane murein-binding lipoprotein Lpp